MTGCRKDSSAGRELNGFVLCRLRIIRVHPIVASKIQFHRNLEHNFVIRNKFNIYMNRDGFFDKNWEFNIKLLILAP